MTTRSMHPYMLAQSLREVNVENTCYHEAAHGVVAAALGTPFRYITRRPRDPGDAGSMQLNRATRTQSYRYGRWQVDAAFTFAGVIAEDFWYEEVHDGYQGAAEHRDKIRRYVIREHGGPDLKIARDTIWRSWSWELHKPGWSATPINLEKDSVFGLAIDTWKLAVVMVARYWSSIDVVAELIFNSRTAIPYSVVRDVIIDEGPDESVEWPLDCQQAWFFKHSRLRWVPSDKWYRQIRDSAREYQLRPEMAAS